MSGRPTPRRGDWIESRGANSSVVLKFYSAPPGHGGGDEIDVPRVGPHQYLGPVHDVDYSDGFVSVLLPHPTTGELAWTNIWSNNKGRGVDYARLVPDEALARWLRHGFQNEYMVSETCPCGMCGRGASRKSKSFVPGGS